VSGRFRARASSLALASLLSLAGAVGCATSGGPVGFPARPAPAGTTLENDEALAAKGYVCLGPLEVAVEKERCHGTDGRPAGCEAVEARMESGGRLLATAAERGGDLVRIAKYEQPTTLPWMVENCTAGTFSQEAAHLGRAPRLSIESACLPTAQVTVGTRHLLVSSGLVWRREPAMVPQMRLAWAVEAGDEARVVGELAHVKDLDRYLAEPPLVTAARKGHVAILRRLLAAGATAGRESALLAAVAARDSAVTRTLLAAGVSPDATDPGTRDRPLHIAAFGKPAPEVLALLLASGADVNALDGADHMPLQSALLGCSIEAARTLLGAGADTRWALADDTALEIARLRCPRETAEIIALISPRR
jgi:hypothetical protein